MSALQYPDAINAPDVQVWNNAAFDNEEFEGLPTVEVSWGNADSVNLSESLESDCSKENMSPVMMKPPVSVKSSVPVKPLCPRSHIGNSQGKASKPPFETPVASKKGGCEEKEEKGRAFDERKIDSEIEEIEKEISRLSSILNALRLEKAEQNALKTVERRGRMVSAKFMEPKQCVKNSDLERKIEEPSLSSAKPKINRRGLSLGPSEIYAGARARPPGKLEITPVQPIPNRRKSCFWKLQDIDELKVIKERGKSQSVSPKSRKNVSKTQAPKQAATVGSKRPAKKEDSVLASIQPKTLFKDGEKEKSVTAKKPTKPGRVVASRYNQTPSQSNRNSRLSDGRKRSLPENDKDDAKRCDKRRASLAGKSCGNKGTESRVKKRWEIPTEVVYKGEEDESAVPIAEVGDQLPKIRTLRCVNETPRDSGAAKRVVELIGMRSYFCNDEEVEPSVCQALNFEEEDAEEE